MKKIAFVILNYNNLTDTIECIQSIHKNKNKDYIVIIVDNASTDGSGQKLKQIFTEDICLLRNKNDGYAAGNNFGIQHALQLGVDYICILNNDVVIPENFVDTVFKSMESNPKISIIGPVVCNYNARELVQSAGAKVDLWTGRGKLLYNNMNVDKLPNNLVTCDYLSGAAFIARTDVFNQVGLLPEFYFLYFEETDWFFKARRQGVIMECIPDLKVYHKGSASVNKVKGLSAYYMTRNQVIFEWRNANSIQFGVFIFYALLRYIYLIFRKRQKSNVLLAFINGIKFLVEHKFDSDLSYKKWV